MIIDFIDESIDILKFLNVLHCNIVSNTKTTDSYALIRNDDSHIHLDYCVWDLNVVPSSSFYIYSILGSFLIYNSFIQSDVISFGNVTFNSPLIDNITFPIYHYQTGGCIALLTFPEQTTSTPSQILVSSTPSQILVSSTPSTVSVGVITSISFASVLTSVGGLFMWKFLSNMNENLIEGEDDELSDKNIVIILKHD